MNRFFLLIVLGWCGCSAVLGEPFDDELALKDANVVAYTHDTGLTLDDAHALQRTLAEHGIAMTIKMHRDHAPPDAAFIGALVSPEAARLVIRALPYTVEYLFRPDYPGAEGGDPSGQLIGVGYMSTHFSALRGELSEPVKIEQSELDHLLDPDISHAEFQSRLRELTKL